MGTDEEKSNVDNMIDANLRKVYESVLQEDVPDRFAKLLDQLKAGERDPGADGGSGPGPSEGDAR